MTNESNVAAGEFALQLVGVCWNLKIFKKKRPKLAPSESDLQYYVNFVSITRDRLFLTFSPCALGFWFSWRVHIETRHGRQIYIKYVHRFVRATGCLCIIEILTHYHDHTVYLGYSFIHYIYLQGYL